MEKPNAKGGPLALFIISGAFGMSNARPSHFTYLIVL